MTATTTPARPAQLPDSLVALARERAETHPDLTVFTFLDDGAHESASLSFRELDERARAVAAELSDRCVPGDRALLVYPPGLDFVVGVLGCFYAGVVCVPTYPPVVERAAASASAIASDAGCSRLLTVTELSPLMDGQPGLLGSLPRLLTDQVPAGRASEWEDPRPQTSTLALLQYTSGSTGSPKGVRLTHGNLLENLRATERHLGVQPEDVAVLWLPPYHDMGLIGGLLQPLYSRMSAVLMSPLTFLEEPVKWLQALSSYRGTVAAAPNFAYDFCVRRTTPDQRAALDLSSWRVALNGAEPVNSATLDRFADTFGPSGFRAEALSPCYGLAENTLMATGVPRDEAPRRVHLLEEALKAHRAERGDPEVDKIRTAVSSGVPIESLEVRIVDTETGAPLGDEEGPRVGEICLQGPTVARGYWGDGKATADSFPPDPVLPGTTWLRTGDLGFLDQGELFVTGRLKDLIIVRGRNHYPQDIEQTTGACHDSARPGGVAAFNLSAPGRTSDEPVAVVQELRRGHEQHAEAVLEAILTAVPAEHGISLSAVALVPAGTVPKTSSGKVRRRGARGAYESGDLASPVLCWTAEGAAPIPQSTSSERPAPDAEGAATPGEAQSTAEASTLDELTELLRREVARLTGRSRELVPHDRPLTALGLDSLKIVNLREVLGRETGRAIPLTTLVEASDLTGIAQAIRGLPCQEGSGENLLPDDLTDVPADIAPQLLERLEDLSEDELDRLLHLTESGS